MQHRHRSHPFRTLAATSRRISLLGALILLAAACNFAAGGDDDADPTPIASAPPTAAATITPPPTAAPTTNPVATAPPAPTFTPLATSIQAPGGGNGGNGGNAPVGDTYALYFVTPEGVGGEIGPIACDSYLTAVQQVITLDGPPQQRIERAVNHLLQVQDQQVGTRRLGNPLAASDLAVSAVTVDAAGNATVALTGQLMLIGVCADPLIGAQIEATAAQFVPGTVTVLVNGQTFADAISQR